MEAKSLFAIEALARAAAVLAAAFAAWGFWYLGIGWFNGREGLDWLNGFQWGALPACAAVAAACAAAVARVWRPWRVAQFMVLATALCFMAFAGARDELYGIDARWFVSPGRELFRVLVLYWAAVSAGLALLAGYLLAPMRWWTALCVAAALILALLSSYLTAGVFPAGRHGDMYNAIRLGYPVFWTAILVPAALRLGRKPAA